MILVLNSGSSSVKFKLFNKDLQPICSGLVERIGTDKSEFHLNFNNDTKNIKKELANHMQALDLVINSLVDEKIINSLDEIKVVGHRVVHGGELYNSAVIVDEEVLNNIYALKKLSPLHNGANGDGIKVITKLLPQATNVAVFDTAFHQTLAPEEYVYPINYDYYTNNRVRRYGAHGTSHKYIYEVISEKLGTNNFKMINCHLGAGSSICAIKNGESIATSMGLTPLGGIMMATRCGDIDPSIVSYLQQELDVDSKEIDHILNKESGLFGVSQISGDIRDVIKASREGNKQASLTIDIFVNRIVDTISSYINKLEGVDIITFTAGIGENSSLIRQKVIDKLGVFGLSIDNDLNQNTPNKINIISKKDAKTRVYVVKLDEELAIAKEAISLLNS